MNAVLVVVSPICRWLSDAPGLELSVKRRFFVQLPPVRARMSVE